MMNGLEPLFLNWTGRRKGIPKGVDETHPNVFFITLGHVVTTYKELSWH